MFRVFNCLANEHDWRLVVLAGVICLLASLVAISLFHRARAANERARMIWLALAGAAGGCGIWATHFIAMLAYEPGSPVAYNLGLTSLSLVLAICFTFTGLFVAIKSSKRWAPPLGGAIFGIGVAGMHYTGMFALEVPGVIAWLGGLVLVSIALGIVFGAVALTIAVRRDDLRGTLAASVLLTLAIVSHHFVAMGAAIIIPNAGWSDPAFALDDPSLAVAVAGIAVAILGISLIGAVADSFLAARTRQFDRAQQQLMEESEQKLRQQNVRLDAALNNMSQGLCMFDAEERIVVLNRRFLEMYKLSPDVVRPGCSLIELLQHRRDTGLLDVDPEVHRRQILDDVAHGRGRHLNTQNRDGRIIEATNERMPDGGWVTTHEDVTDRHKAEAQLREQKLQLDTALENMAQGLCKFDADGKLVLVNRRYLEMYGLEPGTVKPGMTLEQMLKLRRAAGSFDGDVAQYLEGLRSGLAHGKPFSATAKTHDGRTISVVNRPMPGGRWVATHEDITERQQAAEQLREQKLQLDTALNTMAQGLNMFDDAGRLVLCNRRYLEMYRLSADVAKPGSTVHDLVRARVEAGTFFAVDPAAYSAQLHEAMNQRDATSSIMETTDGRVIAVNSQTTPDGKGWVVTHEDITERRRAEVERDRSRAFASTVFENVPTAITLKDAQDLRYVLVNRASEKSLGLPRAEIIGKTALDMFPPDIATSIIEQDRLVLKAGETAVMDEHPIKMLNGETRIVSASRTPIRDQNGKILYLLTVTEDRTQRKRAEAQVAHMAHHDALTDLPNRAAFNECLNSTIETAVKDKSSFALMSLDSDRFKEINDVYGHDIGDKLLREVAQRLQQAAGVAFVARLGGDEFTVIATDGAQPAAAEALADRLLTAIAKDFTIAGQLLRTSISIGIAVYPVDGNDAPTLIANADAALYRAKQEGRGAYRFFEADMDKRLRDRRVLQQDLQTAIERSELTLHYQPQARINGEVIGFEALVRWHHPTRGMVAPGAFISLAEDSGLIVAMGEWVLRQACRQAVSWPKPLQIAINLSPVQFRHGDLPALVHSVLLETGLAPSRLELEITEGVLIGDFSRAVSILRRLKSLGVHIAMDDFGSGYSSLSYLQAFPFDKIKIDQAFISNLERNMQSVTIVRAVIGLARGLGLPVLAEGVETKEQLAFLAKEHCDEVQGYLIGRPQPIENYSELTGQRPPPKKLSLVAS